MREIISQGWTYTDVDLREDLGEGKTNVLDDVRALFSDGFTYTDVDLREKLESVYIRSPFSAGYIPVLDVWDDFRSQLSRARDLRFLVYIAWAVLLALIGALGGRNWQGKISWAAGALGISAAILFVASGPVYTSIGQSQIDELRIDIVQDMDSPTMLLAAEKGLDVVQTVADDFLAGIGRSSLILAVVAGMVFAAAQLWPRFVRRTSPAEEAEAA
jgi:TRAP-type C4-dicarboxylate transport system permease small subunit